VKDVSPTPRQDAAAAFIRTSRRCLTEDYLPRIRAGLSRLPPEDLWWRPNAASNSVGNLLLHLAGNARQWIVSGVGGAADVRLREAEFAAAGGMDAMEALAVLEEAVREADEVLRHLDPVRLGEPRIIQGMEVTVMEAVYDVVGHFAMHTGQILYVVKLRTGSDLGLWKIGEDGTAAPAW
jgi:uncharacterized damage-inducible protein DinB